MKLRSRIVETIVERLLGPVNESEIPLREKTPVVSGIRA